MTIPQFKSSESSFMTLADLQKSESLTPMMQQYLDIKKEYPDCLVWFRLGDFYELFFEDAIQVAKELGIALTKRGKNEGQDIPMCGVPVHASETYLTRLIRKGFRIAICEQIEDAALAKKRGSKAPLKRDVVRVVTAGTLTEESLLPTHKHNFLGVLCDGKNPQEFALATLDMSTGDFFVETVTSRSVAGALTRLTPSELVIPERLLKRSDMYEIFQDWQVVMRPLPDCRFNTENCQDRLEKAFKVKALEAFGTFTPLELVATSTLIDYVQLTQRGGLPRLDPPKKLTSDNLMEIDGATQRNLELTITLQGATKGSFFHIIDRTVTSGGARLLARRLVMPITRTRVINRWLDGVEFFVKYSELRQKLRDLLKNFPDLERALSRLTVGRAGPRDLAAVRDSLNQVLTLRRHLHTSVDLDLSEDIKHLNEQLGLHQDLRDRLQRALTEELPMQAREGNFIAPGYHKDLDEKRDLRDQGAQHILALQEHYIQKTGIKTLKIKNKGTLGYFIEVTEAQLNKVPQNFIPRQSMKGAKRFTTFELTDLESKIATAEEEVLLLELALFQDLVTEIAQRAEDLARMARAVAGFDVHLSLAELADEKKLCRPIVDDSDAFEIKKGRHLVVEAALAAKGGEKFVHNDCIVADGQKVWLLTGPNMAGKSTFLRQNALIAIMAQMGSFVPAEAAHIGVVDRLFSRVGAADDLARGRSTFMVEMVETAAILNQSSPRSLVILDEVGRGTSTYDGVSIAWATLEYLHDHCRCRTLFATHYHELTDLEQRLPHLKCYNMRIKEWQNDVIFLHEVVPGSIDRSYGVHVARLAGLPPRVLDRAQAMLRSLEAQAGRELTSLPLFSVAKSAEESIAFAGPVDAKSKSLEEIKTRLENTLPDELSPKQALELIYDLKSLVSS